MKVGVIGAGPCGLISAKLLNDEGIDFDVFEGNDRVGGTWIYSENFIDKHNLPVQSSMYRNLKTNLPKELMTFEGHDYDVNGISFIPFSDVLNYLQQFSNKFNLESKIKFECLVIKVSLKADTWELVARNLNTDKEETYYYDSIFVCSGHNSNPIYPKICGAESFSGSHIHSHYYRVPEFYQDKVVLVVGIGPSGIDITFDIAPYVKKVYLSHHGQGIMKQHFPDNVIHKPDIKYIDGSIIHFLDDTQVLIEAIIYCTGYKYDYPFLDESCGIQVEENYVYPLYKQLVSIPNSSMFFIGIPFRSFLFPLFEIQVKCGIKILQGKLKLPKKSEMESETKAWEKSLASKGIPKNKNHCIIDCVPEYFSDLIKMGNLKPIPKVLFGIYDICSMIRKSQLRTFRNVVFSISDSSNFTYYEVK